MDDHRRASPHDRPSSLTHLPSLGDIAGLPDAGAVAGTEEVIEEAQAAAPRVAQVRVATELYGDEIQAIKQTLERVFQGPLEIELQLDARIIGGVWVRVGDTVIDGSLRGQLEAMRHHLHAQCRVMMTSGAPFAQPQRQSP